MPRPLRIHDEGHVFHLISRGNNKQVIFREREDKYYFCAQVALARREFKIRMFNFCLMDNHVHLLVESMAPGAIAGLMRVVLGMYAQWFNRKYDHVGHVFQGRYKSFLVQTETYFLRCLRYIDRNAPKAGVVAGPRDFEFCGHRYLAFGENVPLKIDVHEIYHRLAQTLATRRQRYRDFVLSSDDADFDLMDRRQCVLGDEFFIKQIKFKGV